MIRKDYSSGLFKFILTFDEKLQKRKLIIGWTNNYDNFYDLNGNTLPIVKGVDIFALNNGYFMNTLFIKDLFNINELNKISKYCSNVKRYCVEICHNHDYVFPKNKYNIKKLKDIEKKLNKLLDIQHVRADSDREKLPFLITPYFGSKKDRDEMLNLLKKETEQSLQQ